MKLKTHVMILLLTAAVLLGGCAASQPVPETAATAAPVQETAVPTVEPVQETLPVTVPETQPEQTEAPKPGELLPKIGEFYTVFADADSVGFREDPEGDHYGFTEDFWEDSPKWDHVDSYTVAASCSSWLPLQNGIDYLPGNVKDGSRNSVWSEGAEGYGIGEYVELTNTFRAEQGSEDALFHFNSLCIVNGYAETGHKWEANSRVKTIELYVNGNYRIRLQLEDTMKPQYFDISGLELSVPSGTDMTFRFVIADVYPGEEFHDTCITGIAAGFEVTNG